MHIVEALFIYMHACIVICRCEMIVAGNRYLHRWASGLRAGGAPSPYLIPSYL